jgi:hypothetical protein
MVVVPVLTPVTMPLVDTVATPVLLLAHDEPGVTSDSVVVDPAQVLTVPIIAAGSGLMVTVVVR